MEATLKIRAGYDIAFNCFQEVPMLLMVSVHPSRQQDLLTQHAIRFSPNAEARDFRDAFGNVFNSPYPTAPFSTLYLFGRGQDIGFQKAIDNSPRKRHHIRFWALSVTRAQATWGAAGFWLNTDRPPDNERVLWVGAGTRDTGLSLTRLTFQITHATDSDTNAERDHIIAELTKSRTIEAVKVYQSGQDLLTEHVNHYVTDGEIALASLVVKDP